MTTKPILKQLKKDYLNYILSFVNRKKLKFIKPEFCAPKILADIINQLFFKKTGKPDFVVKWDADADRVFFKDEKGRKIPAYFITALLAKIIQQKYPKAKISHDSRLVWAIKETVLNTYICKAGWPNFLNFMHKNKILFGGEASGHYYFNRDFAVNDGIIPVLLIAECIGKTKKSLSELIRPYKEKYFISGEIKFKKKIDLKKLEKNYQDAKISYLDGLSIEYPNWRFNLRPSQTEDLWRLNIEARNKNILQEKKKELYENIAA